MIKQTFVAALLSVALGTTAFAAGPGGMDSTKNAGGTGSSAQQTTGSAQNSQSAQNLPQQIRSKLQNSGFTDITVVPQTFAVSAKDRDGDPVMMMIGPHTMTIIQAMNAGDQQTTGSGSSSSGKSTSSRSSK